MASNRYEEAKKKSTGSLIWIIETKLGHIDTLELTPLYLPTCCGYLYRPPDVARLGTLHAACPRATHHAVPARSGDESACAARAADGCRSFRQRQEGGGRCQDERRTSMKIERFVSFSFPIPSRDLHLFFIFHFFFLRHKQQTRTGLIFLTSHLSHTH